jgi:hypothetical protein
MFECGQHIRDDGTAEDRGREEITVGTFRRNQEERSLKETAQDQGSQKKYEKRTHRTRSH